MTLDHDEACAVAQSHTILVGRHTLRLLETTDGGQTQALWLYTHTHSTIHSTVVRTIRPDLVRLVAVVHVGTHAGGNAPTPFPFPPALPSDGT